MMMKKMLTTLIGMAVILTFGLASAAEDTSEFQGTNDKTIRNEDSQHLNMDKDHATVNQMPAESGTAGTGAGGVHKESDSAYKNSNRGMAPVENTPTKHEDAGSGAGGSSDDYYNPGY
ncbi:MAG TPA: hypothetical protein VEI57_06405 [Nitrospirota bacterium]|nr:hypothetical protein [Nitrospirota bacterium]